MTAVPERLSDAELIAAVRRGDTKAYGELYERHLGAANRAAAYLVTTTAEREDLVAEAFTRVLQVLRSGRGPAHDFRPYLLVTMRHAAINAARRGPSTALFAELPDAYLRAATDDPVDARLTGNEAVSAFAGLPERWRQVLWHTEVEGASPAAIAPMLGMTPNGVAALAYRAREGLRQAYLRMHLPPVDRRDCREATDKLAGWVRRSISEPQHRKISAHLRTCPRCREIAAGLREVNGEMRVDLAPVVSWLSALKGALSATVVKVGAAAAVAAVAAGIIASEPHGADRHPATADPGNTLPKTPVTSGGGEVSTEEPRPVEYGSVPPVAALPALARVEPGPGGPAGSKPAKATEPRKGPDQETPASPARASSRGKHAGPPERPVPAERPAQPAVAAQQPAFAPAQPAVAAARQPAMGPGHGKK